MNHRLIEKLRRFWYEAFFNTDPLTIDIGRDGELLMARIRFVFFVGVALMPLQSVVIGSPQTENWVGLIVVSLGLLLAGIIMKLAGRPKPPRLLSLISSQIDVILVSLAHIGFFVINKPIVASNSFTAYNIYLLLIAATALRADTIVAISAGLSAAIQYSVIIFFAHRLTLGVVDSDYGSFHLNNQLARIMLILLMTLLASAIVLRNRSFWRASVRDKLTGLHNRRFFDDFLEYKIAECRRHGRTFALVFLDIDHFKQINDQFGHATGDQVLSKAGEAIHHFFRDSDIVARYGGEEFTMILPDTSNNAVLHRLHHFREYLRTTHQHIAISATMGVSFYPDDAIQPESLIHIADTRMYQGKLSGRNCVVHTDN